MIRVVMDLKVTPKWISGVLIGTECYNTGWQLSNLLRAGSNCKRESHYGTTRTKCQDLVKFMFYYDCKQKIIK